ncbi:MAG TPA: glycoside hydrolase family 172 protein, partial [Longimicrobiales bacterium]|nr:glycoside hydrolase family 172 protein [Longimicrobiales bacterium]
VVRRWWVTVAPRNDPVIQRGLVVRCYWDGETTPSVEAPLSDFFGVGFGEWKDFVSLPLAMTSGGFNTYWPMPFRTRARITVENTSGVPVEKLYYNVDVRTYEDLPDEILYFHAQYRRTVTEAGEPVVVLEAEGRGHYVGTLMSMEPLRGAGFGYLEGDERIFVDGAEEPAVVGTGTEDYFSSGWYFDTGEYSAPYHGVTVKDPDRGRISAYRWHIEDPIPFRESLRFTVEHGGTNDAPGVEYATVAFWYQTHPHAPFPPLGMPLLPSSRASVPTIEAEALLETARVSGGRLERQDMSTFEGRWGGDAQLWWIDARPGDRLTLPLEVPEAGTWELVGFFTRGPDYGIVQMRVGGRALEPLVDGFDRSVGPSGPVWFGRVTLTAGANDIAVDLLGKDARSAGYGNGYLVGVDGFVLRRVGPG